MLFAPLAWHIREGDAPEPDLMVVDPAAVGERAIVRPPVLVVEVLSAWGRIRDRTHKRDPCGSAGCPHYWIVDPDEPSHAVLD